MIVFVKTDGADADLARMIVQNGADRPEPFDPETVRSVEAVCGPIGVVYPPAQYLSPRGSLYFYVHRPTETVVAYAAVRKESRSHMVIDAFGVVGSLRRTGLGAKFFAAIEQDLLEDCGCEAAGKFVKLSLQATFDSAAYSRALSKHSRPSEDGKSVTVDLERVALELTGSCSFWARMGFDRRRLEVSRETGCSLLNPCLLMWRIIAKK
jgi:hypothetical protein